MSLDDIPTLGDALLGKPTPVRLNGSSRVHRMADDHGPDDERDDLPKSAPIRFSVLGAVQMPPPPTVPPPPQLTPFTQEPAMPTGHYDRSKSKPRRKRAQGGAEAPAVPAAASRKPRAHRITPPPKDDVRFSIDDAGGISLTPEHGEGILLDAAATKRLELFLDRTKALRK